MLPDRWGKTKRGADPPVRRSPPRPAAARPMTRPCRPHERKPMPKTVMIVEDNELNMKLFNDLLESRGYSIIQTRNGMEALDLARAHHPDLILMDIQLPEVSGLVVTKWLKEDDDLAAIPVIAVTAFAMKGDEERILQGGCEGYISKPISVPHFLETIARYIGPAN
jgi:two-component system cell cycle response regulator DivK